ncbi:hypothetical protein ILYODFUR_003695 [Ilyodon furcidens]|uniref:Uncharacterized protein n=1 Tax=Ilyodon furcidens TaxID=33524 RepID=A0ABV0TIN4_9TELE
MPFVCFHMVSCFKDSVLALVKLPDYTSIILWKRTEMVKVTTFLCFQTDPCSSLQPVFMDRTLNRQL